MYVCVSAVYCTTNRRVDEGTQSHCAQWCEQHMRCVCVCSYESDISMCGDDRCVVVALCCKMMSEKISRMFEYGNLWPAALLLTDTAEKTKETATSQKKRGYAECRAGSHFNRDSNRQLQ